MHRLTSWYTVLTPPRCASIGLPKRTGRPSSAISPASIVVDAGEDLDQGRLAGAVLAHQGVDFAGEEPQIHVVERLDADEGLVDPAHPEDRVRGHAASLSSSAHEPPRCWRGGSGSAA